jgi:hypothetical protein
VLKTTARRRNLVEDCQEYTSWDESSNSCVEPTCADIEIINKAGKCEACTDKNIADIFQRNCVEVTEFIIKEVKY